MFKCPSHATALKAALTTGLACLLFLEAGCIVLAPVKVAGEVAKTAVSTTGTVAGAAVKTTGAVAKAAVSTTVTVTTTAVNITAAGVSAAASLAKSGFVVLVNTGGGPALQIPHVQGLLLAGAIQATRLGIDAHSAKIVRGKKELEIPQDRWAETYLEDGDVVVVGKSGKE